MNNRITAILARIERGETTIGDAEIIRQHINALTLRAVADKERIRALRNAARAVCAAIHNQEALDDAIVNLAAVSHYQPEI